MTEIEKRKADRAFVIFQQVKQLKSNVVDSILEIGKCLCEIEDDKLYKFLGFETLEETIASPEISFSRASAYNYMRLHRIYVQRLDIGRERLIEITQGKLLAISSVVEQDPETWLVKARELSRSDLRSEVGEYLGKVPPPSRETPDPSTCLPVGQFKDYTEFVKAQPCAICNRKDTVVGHHFPRTKGASADEWKVIPLCVWCHSTSHVMPSAWLWENRIKIFDYFYDIIGSVFVMEEK